MKYISHSSSPVNRVLTRKLNDSIIECLQTSNSLCVIIGVLLYTGWCPGVCGERGDGPSTGEDHQSSVGG